jgi:hypothetical protein
LFGNSHSSDKLHSWLSEDIGFRGVLVHLGIVVGLHNCPVMQVATMLKSPVVIDDYRSLNLLTIQFQISVSAEQEMRQHGKCSPKNSFLRNSCNGCRTTISSLNTLIYKGILTLILKGF